MKVAIACDHLLARDYSVEIVERLCELYPHAEIYTFAFKEGSVSGEVEKRKIHASYLSNKVKSLADLEKHKFLLPNISKILCREADFDLLLSVSSGFSHGLEVPAKAKHLSYIWNNVIYGKVGFFSKIFAAFLKSWQKNSLKKLDAVLFSSESLFNVEIEKIIKPPVNIEEFPQVLENPAETLLVNISSLDAKTVKKVNQICVANKITAFFMDTSHRQMDWFSTGVESEKLIISKCPTDLKHLFYQCFAMLDLSPGTFNPEMVAALALGRPLILWDYQINQEYFSRETAIFIEPKNWTELNAKLKELIKHKDAFFPNILQRKSFAFHPTKFKKIIQKEVNNLQKGT